MCHACGTNVSHDTRFCPACGTRLLPRLTSRERRRVSVVFLDLVGFTGLSSELEPEEVGALAQDVLAAESEITRAHDGRVDSLKGDGLIAIFGAPYSHPDDANRAVLTASASLEAVRAIGRARGIALEGRASVNTGVAIAGVIGSGEGRRYTVMGSAVNLAAKLEAAATPGHVLVGSETFQATRHAFEYESVGPLRVRGVASTMPAYRLLSVPSLGEPDPFASLPLLGRERELAALRQAWERVWREDKARTVWIAGPAGAGKSRLLEAFERSIGDRARFLAIDPRPGFAFSWRSLEGPVFGTSPDDTDQVRRARVGAGLEQLLPHEPRWRHAVLESLDLVDSGSWTRLDRRSVSRALLAWRDVLAAFARSAPASRSLVVALDGEPADEILAEFMAALHDADAPILTVRTTRRRAAGGDEHVVDLGPLSIEDSMVLVDAVASPVLRPASEALVQLVGGVPAFVLELARALAQAEPASLSQALTGLLQSNLDLLEMPARLLLAHAALAGDTVWHGLLEMLVVDGAARHIRDLREQHLLVPKEPSGIPGETAYRFHSEVLRRVSGQMVPHAERRLLHLRIATWLEEHAPPAFSELMARQFEQGGSPDAAHAHYLTAAEMAGDEGDLAEARRLFEAALALNVGAALYAGAALAYAATELALGDPELARGQLDRAQRWLATVQGDALQDLSEQERQLRKDLQARA